ncbi:hypothetical protein [Novacetimonas hansenii]|uniref:hypothetical protein n=1 Tax=Novacetimonas hansenii TaxID=436 RepID=UPI00248D5087|nr:hypothetical protein [Novacetimonas hansenii]
MIPLLVMLWVGCLACHAALQPARYRLPDLSARYRIVMGLVRGVAPALALGVALAAGVVVGVVLWCTTFSVAGLIVAACIVAWSMRRH